MDSGLKGVHAKEMSVDACQRGGERREGREIQLVSIDRVPPCHQQRLYSQAICIVNRNKLASRSSQSLRHETF
jgi:hypothetical protein